MTEDDIAADAEVREAQKLADRGRVGNPADLLSPPGGWTVPAAEAQVMVDRAMPRKQRRLVFDIETAPLPDALAYLAAEPIEAPANYKDPAKIAAYIAEKRAEQLDRCSLDVDLCRVVAIGWQIESGKPMSMTGMELDEKSMLSMFWVVAHDCHLVGFNCLAFDLPVLLRRSLYLGITPPQLNLDKYRHDGITDLMRVLDYNGMIRTRGLAFYCKRFGIEGAPDTIDGSGIAAAVERGDWKAIEAHVTADVVKTAKLATKLRHFSEVRS